MKTTAIALAFIAALTLALTGCADLAGLNLSLDDQGNATLSVRPIIIPAK